MSPSKIVKISHSKFLEHHDILNDPKTVTTIVPAAMQCFRPSDNGKLNTRRLLKALNEAYRPCYFDEMPMDVAINSVESASIAVANLQPVKLDRAFEALANAIRHNYPMTKPPAKKSPPNIIRDIESLAVHVFNVRYLLGSLVRSAMELSYPVTDIHEIFEKECQAYNEKVQAICQ